MISWHRCFKLSGLGISALFLLAGCGGGGSGGGNAGASPQNYTLSVQSFGDGTVTSGSAGGINCDGSSGACSETYPAGTSVVLTASGNNGYQFASWAGCDSVTGNACTVTVDGDKSVFPTFAKPLVLAAQTKVLSNATMQLLVSQDGTTYTFSSQATEIAALQPGDIMASNSGNGLLRRVVSVTVDGQGQYVVQTDDATLEDAISEGTVSVAKQLTTADLAPGQVGVAGISPQAAPGGVVPQAVVASPTFTIDIDQVLYDEDGNDQTTNDQVKLTGSLQSQFSIDCAVDKPSVLSPVKEFKTVLISSSKRDLKLIVGGKVNLFNKKVPLENALF